MIFIIGEHIFIYLIGCQCIINALFGAWLVILACCSSSGMANDATGILRSILKQFFNQNSFCTETARSQITHINEIGKKNTHTHSTANGCKTRPNYQIIHAYKSLYRIHFLFPHFRSYSKYC